MKGRPHERKGKSSAFFSSSIKAALPLTLSLHTAEFTNPIDCLADILFVYPVIASSSVTAMEKKRK